MQSGGPRFASTVGILGGETRAGYSDFQERILDANTAQYCAMLQVFTVEMVRARQTRRVNDHRIPE